MPISIVVRQEGGDEICRSDEVYVAADVTFDGLEYPLLGGIDAYADTVFNGRQISRLLPEVERLLQLDLTDQELASLLAVKAMCREGLIRGHRYLWFVGD